MTFLKAASSWKWAILLVLGLVSHSVAAPKQASSTAGVVDVVDLKGGKSLRGGIAWQEPSGVLVMIVSANWYQDAFPTKFADLLAENGKQRRLALIQTRDRIADELKAIADQPALSFFFKSEMERIDRLIADENPPDPDFLWIEVLPQAVARIRRANQQERAIALFAWDARLEKVETRSAKSLETELSEKGMKFDRPSPDLSPRWPARPQTDQEWAARLALVKYSLAKPLDFQGIGATLVRIEEGQRPDLGQILPQLLQQQFKTLLKDLASEGAQPNRNPAGAESLKSAIREAESINIQGFRVTRVAIDTTAAKASVETSFVAKTGKDRWQTVWRTAISEEGTKGRPEFEQRIEQDPQFKTVSDSIKSTGLFDANTMQQAVRFGAATMAAQQSADKAFFEFRDFSIRRLDGPPLRISDGP